MVLYLGTNLLSLGNFNMGVENTPYLVPKLLDLWDHTFTVGHYKCILEIRE